MNLQEKSVLVTGAAGFLGGALVARLSERGAPIRALARSPERAGYIRDRAGVDVVAGDILDVERMRQISAGCDALFHVAAALDGSLDHQRRVNVEGTRAVMQAAVDAGVRRVVHVSTVAVYGYGVRGDVTEDRAPEPGSDPYNLSKAEAEAVVKSFRDRVETVIVRPGAIYGPRSGFWTGVWFRLGRRRPTIFIGDGRGNAPVIYVDDVVDLLLRAADHPAAAGKVFNCAPDPAPTWRDFLQGYSRLAGHDRWLGLPPALVDPAAWIASVTARPYTPRKEALALVRYARRRVTYKTGHARDLLGWQPQISLDEGIRRCEPWLREKGLLG
jgi:nucleoside-diphosphate-sugar epimerase